MSMVERWVGDKLHDILGISDKHIAQYLIGLAGKASSSDDFVRRLKDTGTVDVDANMVNFCNELWNKVSSPTCFGLMNFIVFQNQYIEMP